MTLLLSTAALLGGFLLDALWGDPRRLPHITRLMGRMIAALEQWLRRVLPKHERGERRGGMMVVLLMLLFGAAAPLLLLLTGYRLSPAAGWALETLLCWQLLAAKSLKSESMKVGALLCADDLRGARQALSMIVGRDTAQLKREGVIRAAVETVAENSSDGVVAPLFYLMLGGAPLCCLYKAANTMDSMLGYKNARYLHFGYAAAKTDDALSFIPARLCALLMIAAAFLLRYDGKAAFRIWRRDRHQHASPNSAQTEAVCAGALGIRLAGPASYGGQRQVKPYIGDDTRAVEVADIAAANRLMYAAALLMLLLALLFRAAIWALIFGR